MTSFNNAVLLQTQNYLLIPR